MTDTKLSVEVASQLLRIKRAGGWLRSSSVALRNQVLEELAKRIQAQRKALLKANQDDLARLDASATAAFRDRLTLNEARLNQATESLNQVALLSDPLGQEGENRSLKNGLIVKRVRSPLGTLLMIFESRPNVALEAFSLAFKSGNCLILRGGKEAMQTTAVIYNAIGDSLKAAGAPQDVLWGITDPDRSLLYGLLRQKEFIDVVIPRGGDSLIHFVVQNSNIPIIKNDRGMCHVFIDDSADIAMAVNIVANAKTQRPGVCNAMETLLVHSKIQAAFLPKLYEALSGFPVEWFGCSQTVETLKGQPHVMRAHDENWNTEYLDLKMNCRVVASLDEAIEHIERYGSKHSESIVTTNENHARRFQSEIDAAAVYWNASTRFTDGFELGLGGELGISTQKLHVRGPVGLKELTSLRWVFDGAGQIRK